MAVYRWKMRWPTPIRARIWKRRSTSGEVLADALQGHPAAGDAHAGDTEQQQNRDDVPQRTRAQSREIKAMQPALQPAHGACIAIDDAKFAGGGTDVNPRALRVAQDGTPDRQ